MILKNKGMYLETIINNSISVNASKHLLIQKMPLSGSIFEVNNSVIKARLTKHTFCDYVGLFHGHYLEFDAKETELNYFSLSNIKTKQLEKLKTVAELSGLAFIVVYFHKIDKYFGLTYKEITQFQTKKYHLNGLFNMVLKFTLQT
ncbi:Holliday junction-specific endonuclease [Spiroplasma clarkii]|uniref:Holliday junction resolvase RecU n=1 Tax=Spiroplasma clarkii TaxID=2139 RepID=UPI000B5559B7|nr:Holliday junction resolvase RecU [Spiroplasma clarkii]ARU92026.1 Holliday junction-specific endonuclease [Spiroplasma clarkii]